MNTGSLRGRSSSLCGRSPSEEQVRDQLAATFPDTPVQLVSGKVKMIGDFSPEEFCKELTELHARVLELKARIADAARTALK